MFLRFSVFTFVYIWLPFSVHILCMHFEGDNFLLRSSPVYDNSSLCEMAQEVGVCTILFAPFFCLGFLHRKARALSPLTGYSCQCIGQKSTLLAPSDIWKSVAFACPTHSISSWSIDISSPPFVVPSMFLLFPLLRHSSPSRLSISPFQDVLYRIYIRACRIPPN